MHVIKLEDIFSPEKKANLKEFISKHKQKQNIIDMMKADEVDELYNEAENDERMNIIGQNGNEGIHYELEYEPEVKEKVIESYNEVDEVKQTKARINELTQLLKSNLSSWRIRKIHSELNSLYNLLNQKNEDETKTY
jgi:Mg/Co/Ni transporter MgtE